MLRNTFSITPAVCIRVKGPARKDPKTNLFDSVPLRLQAFLLTNQILPIVHGELDKTEYVGFFTAEDAAKIEAWLREEGRKK